MAERHTHGPAIKALRIAYGLAQVDVAKSLGISSPYLSNIEAGRKPRLPLGITRRIADVLGVDLAAITYAVPTPARDATLLTVARSAEAEEEAEHA